MTFKEWLTQPTTITGLGAAAATISGLIAHVITGDTTAAVAAGGAAYALVAVALPDNTAAANSIEKLITDAVTAAAQHKLAAALPMLIQDGLAVAAAFGAPAVPVTTTTTITTQPAAVAVVGATP